VQRETTFQLGGALTIALGLALAAGLVWGLARLRRRREEQRLLTA